MQNFRDLEYLKQRSETELRDLLFEGKVSINDARVALNLRPMFGGDSLEESLVPTKFAAGASRVGTINVSMELLAKLLHFPDGHIVADVRRVDTTPSGAFEVLCAGPTLPEVQEGELIPQVDFTVTQMVLHGVFSAKAPPKGDDEVAA